MKATNIHVLGFPEVKKKNYFNNNSLKLPKFDNKH